jgi:hypothetical protein
VTKSARILTLCLCDLLCFNPIKHNPLTVLHCVFCPHSIYASVPYDSHNEGQLLTVLHYAVGLCVGGLQRGKREGALNYLCITEVLFKVSLFSCFFLHFSLYFHSFLFYIFNFLILQKFCLFWFYWLLILFLAWGTRWRSFLRHRATSRKVAVSIPDGVTWIFHWHNLSGRTMAQRSTQPVTKMSTRNISCR